MHKRMLILGVVILASVSSALARGGGGCLRQGTPILTPDGPVSIERLGVGDRVISVADGELKQATVLACYRVDAQDYRELRTQFGTVLATAEHPFMVARGVFRIADSLREGDTVYVWRDGSLAATRLLGVRQVEATLPAFNLMVSAGGTFIAGGMVVHNKGCFLGDTPILRGDGTASHIRDVRPGDTLLAFWADGRTVRATVRSVLSRQVDEYLAVTIGNIRVEVTPEHPFYVGQGVFKTIESLVVGDHVYAYDGTGLSAQPIVSIRRIHAPTTVYNLQTDQPHTFFANGIAVHNKGGGGGGGGGGIGGGGFHGGGYSSGGGGGSLDTTTILWISIFIVVFFVYPIIKAVVVSRSKEDQNLDYSYSPATIKLKADKTTKLLEFIARQDPTFNVDALAKTAADTFVKLQQCWQARDYTPMKDLLMPDLYAQHCKEIAGLIRNHEINLIEGVEVKFTDIVNVRYTFKPDDREFTALITAMARDYYINDRTKQFIRGDDEPASFQEFWTFHLQGGRWMLREIEQTRESDVLKEENFFEQMTDGNVKQVYGAAAGKSGQAGPWLEKGAELKATRIERLLNFLVQTDKLWDRQQMLQRARDVFMNVYAAREAGDANAVSGDELFPDIAEHLRQEIVRCVAQGTTIEFRNLCIRKAELILVRNYSDNGKDEFTARISAHAQQVVKKGGSQIAADPYVIPFEEYWTFGRLDNKWKLKEVLPAVSGQQAIDTENVDEDTSPAQLQWYYQQTRAN